MSSSKSEDQTEISIDVSREEKNNVPHGGKKIDNYVLSPNMKCIATLSEEDKSIVVWSITDELNVNYESSLNVNDLEHALNTDNFCKKPGFNFEIIFDEPDVLVGISNYKQVIIRLSGVDFVIDFAIIDIRTKLRQILLAQGLEGWTKRVAFLENEDLVVIKLRPVYRAYIFSKPNINGKQKWACKNCIELEKKVNLCYITKKGKLFMRFNYTIPIVMQWDLITRKFDMQYILDLNFGDIRMDLNSDNTLLAISGDKIHDYGSVICVYLTKSGMMIANKIFGESLRNCCFIGSGEEERLFFSGPHHETKGHNSYILNPRTHTLNKAPDTHVLYDIYHVAFNDKSIGPINIIDYCIFSDYIIKNNNNSLLIQKLSQNDIWIECLKHKEHYYGNTYTYFNIKEIMQFMQEILDKYNDNEYKPDRTLTQNYSNEQELYSMEPFNWIIEYKKEEKFWNIQLQAQIETDKRICAVGFNLDYGSILEIKVLKNGDILLVCQLSIQIYTIEDFKIKLIYCWFDESEFKLEAPKLPKLSIINLLTLFKKNLIFYNFGSEILPSPTTLALTYKSISYRDFANLTCNNSTLLKLYGKHIFKLLLNNWFSLIPINQLLNYCYDYGLSMLKKGDIFSFILITSQIAFILTKLEKSNKYNRFTEEFLSKTNMLIGHPLTCYEIKDSLLFNLQHYENNVDLHNLYNTSFFNYFVFWISKKCDLLKKSYPQAYQIFAFPYLLYSSYIIVYHQETVRLMFPLLGFATYSKKYSYSELFYLQGNPFTSLLDSPDYYKWWNIKALINFKWNTYGRLYYFIIWAIYLIFMCCFLIVSTIPEHKISWNDQEILLIATIFFGFMHFIFEVRQFIYKPMAYIASPWNWFDLAAILVPTITSIIWLHYKTPSTWIITIAAFLLEIKFLLFFRTLDYFGTYFAIMIGVAQKVFSFLVVLGIIVLAFAHSLHLLLRPTSEYSYDQPSFTNDSNNPWNLVPTYQFISSNGTVGTSMLIETPDDSTNLFTMFSTSILAVYFMLTGDLSYISSWILKNNWTLAFLLVIFSFFTTVYLLNLFISLLGNAIDVRNNEESFLQLRGEILSEIELFWMLPYQRRKTNWFPEILWYRASVKELKKYIEDIEDKQSFDPKILKITKTEDSDEKLKKLINETITNQINEVLKDPLDKINKLIELIEKK
ncbi:transient receptor potential cation channel subfamily a member 1-like [Gigaspora margarita]|uniref:Transient receptor potential cation channel subfamily a member 1-like n=1 Tax=Gigaspora margarita TaxID=4874 RepID=A0A8H4B487_GIGMA|nr:transient receptor potential cation channel subfamily a member 1-like [Gigaspora margarita]